MANNNFKAFEFGLRIVPGLAADPTSGKIGEIYWNIPKNVLRICTSSSPIVWQDLFIFAGILNDATLRWDTASDRWIENTNLLISNNTIYTPNGATGTGLELKSGTSTDPGVDGADILLNAGLGGAGADQGKILINSNIISSVTEAVARNLELKSGDTTTPGNDGGELVLSGGEGLFALGVQEETLITFRDDINGDLSNTYFYIFAKGKEYYGWFNSNLPGLAQDQDITINDNGAALQTGGVGLYWTISSAFEDYYVWYNTGTESDPGVFGTGIEITVAPTDTTTDVADKTVAVLAGFIDFTTSNLLNVINILNNDVGEVGVATAGTTTSGITVNVYGYDKAQDPEIPNKIGISIPFNINDTADLIAGSAILAFNNTSDFLAILGSNPEDVEVTNVNTGAVNNAVDITVGGLFYLSVTVNGINDIGFNGDISVVTDNRVDLIASHIGIKAISTNDPLNSEEGDIYFNSNYNRFRKFADSKWSWIESDPNHTSVILIDYKDDSLTDLPLTTATFVDGVEIVDGDLVLFTNLLVGYNKIYKASVSGTDITWSLVGLGQDEYGRPSQGDIVYIIGGDTNFSLIFKYSGSQWVDIGSNLVESVNQNRGLTVVGGGTKVFNESNILSWSENAYISVPGLDDSRNTILAGSVTLSNNNDVAYVLINRTSGASANLTPIVAKITDVPSDAATGQDVVIFARRVQDQIIWGINGGRETFENSGVYREVTLIDDTTDVLLQELISKCDGKIISYSISRGTDREVGYLYLMTDGTNATVVGNSGSLGATGVYFSAIVDSGLLKLMYTTDNSGDDAKFRYRVQKFLTA